MLMNAQLFPQSTVIRNDCDDTINDQLVLLNTAGLTSRLNRKRLAFSGNRVPK